MNTVVKLLLGTTAVLASGSRDEGAGTTTTTPGTTPGTTTTTSSTDIIEECEATQTQPAVSERMNADACFTVVSDLVEGGIACVFQGGSNCVAQPLLNKFKEIESGDSANECSGTDEYLLEKLFQDSPDAALVLTPDMAEHLCPKIVKADDSSQCSKATTFSVFRYYGNGDQAGLCQA